MAVLPFPKPEWPSVILLKGKGIGMLNMVGGKGWGLEAIRIGTVTKK